MEENRKKLTLKVVTAIKKSRPFQKKVEQNLDIDEKEKPKRLKLKDLEKFSKTVRFPRLWREEIESHIDYPTDLSSFIVEAIKEKMEREEMNTFIG